MRLNSLSRHALAITAMIAMTTFTASAAANVLKRLQLDEHGALFWIVALALYGLAVFGGFETWKTMRRGLAGW